MTDLVQITFGPFELDLRSRTLSRGGIPVGLGNRAAEILCALAEANGAMVSKDTLLTTIWPGQIVEENTLQAQVSGLRRALGDVGSRRIITVPGRGYRLEYDERVIHDTLTGPAVSERPSIAILPFTNLSNDPEQEYFADGIVEDITTALSHVRWLFVIARNSSFTYKNRSIDVRTVGRELGVRYVLEGSVRKTSKRVRITGQLIDAQTREHVWADRFDGELQEVFSLQDEVTDSIVRAIAPTLRHAELARVRRKRPENLDAYDLYLRALPHWYAMAREASDIAMRLLERSLSLDPEYAPALAVQAQLLAYRAVQGWTRPVNARHPEMLRLVRASVRCDPHDPEVLAGAAHLLAWGGGEFEEALQLGERACALGPNSAFVWTQVGAVKFHAGHSEDAAKCFRLALKLDPVDPMGFSILTHLAFALINMGDEAEAADLAMRATRQNPSFAFAWRALAAALGLAGRLEDGRAALRELLVIDPRFCIADVIARTPAAPVSFKRTIEGLRLLDAPE